jgi:hypothetical protein
MNMDDLAGPGFSTKLLNNIVNSNFRAIPVRRNSMFPSLKLI